MEVGVEAGLGELQDFAEQFCHLANLLPDVLKQGRYVWRCVLRDNLDRKLHPGQGGAQFVGDVAEKTLLAGDKLLQTLPQMVQGIGKPANLIAPLNFHPGVKLALCHAARCVAHFSKGQRDAPHQGHPEEGGTQKQRRSDPQRGRVQQESARKQRGGNHQQRGRSAPAGGIRREPDPRPVQAALVQQEAKVVQGGEIPGGRFCFNGARMFGGGAVPGRRRAASRGRTVLPLGSLRGRGGRGASKLADLGNDGGRGPGDGAGKGISILAHQREGRVVTF